MKTTGYTNRELLLSVKRLCTEKNCFRNAKPDEIVLDFYKGTMKMVDEELAKGSTPDADSVETIIFNMLTVIGNAALYFDDTQKVQRKEPIIFETTDIDCSKICRFLGASTKIADSYETVEIKRRKAERINTPEHKKMMRIAKYILFAMIVIAGLVFISGRFFSSQEATGNIFTKIIQWYKYDIRKETVPVQPIPQWARISGLACAAMAGLWIAKTIIARISQILSRRKNEHVREDWNDYQRLCDVFKTASSQMNELEW